VPLSSVASIEELPAPAAVSHEGGERRIHLSASPSSADLSGAVARLESRLRSLELPAGYRVIVGGEAAVRGAAGRRLLLLVALVLAAIFALLALAFSSMRDAIIVMINLPLGIVGGVAAAALTPEGFSVAGFVGFVTLLGIITRNGI